MKRNTAKPATPNTFPHCTCAVPRPYGTSRSPAQSWGAQHSQAKKETSPEKFPQLSLGVLRTPTQDRVGARFILNKHTRKYP